MNLNKSFSLNKRSLRGMTLFEVMLALGIFGIAMIGLAAAMNASMEAAIRARTENRIRQGLESKFAEIRIKPIQEGQQEFADDGSGIKYESIITRWEATNQDRTVLNGLYKVLIRAQWVDNGTPEMRESFVIIYQP